MQIAHWTVGGIAIAIGAAAALAALFFGIDSTTRLMERFPRVFIGVGILFIVAVLAVVVLAFFPDLAR